MLAVAKDNLDLVWYLITQVLSTRSSRFNSLKQFVPDANPDDWYQIIAGQRVQVIKPDAKKGGILQFGTEVLASSDGSIAGLLGASPGASTAVPIMLGVLERCFPDRLEAWTPQIKKMVPSYGTQLSEKPQLAKKTIKAIEKALAIA
jgi:malate dehydrogenase (quinone)